MSNPYLLVADGKASQVLALLEQDPAIASAQDSHGYSLVHAAASYNEFDLLRKLVRDYNVNVNIRDEDEETPLFSVETVDAAKFLVEELGADVLATGTDGITAAQSIEEDGVYPEVAQYLKRMEDQKRGGTGLSSSSSSNGASGSSNAPNTADSLPSVPEGLKVRLDTMDESAVAGIEVDPEVRARIEELASRDGFNTPEGQAQLKQLVQDVIAGQDFAGEARNVRPKTDG